MAILHLCTKEPFSEPPATPLMAGNQLKNSKIEAQDKEAQNDPKWFGHAEIIFWNNSPGNLDHSKVLKTPKGTPRQGAQEKAPPPVLEAIEPLQVFVGVNVNHKGNGTWKESIIPCLFSLGPHKKK